MDAIAKKRWSAALEAILAATDMEPENPRNLVLRSLVLSRCSKKAKGNPLEVALADAKRALRLDHGYAEAWAALGIAYARLGHSDWAVEALEECKRHDEAVFERYGKEIGKIKKKLPSQRRPEPWVFSEERPKSAGDQRNEPVMEMDSLGNMTIRSQMKRVMMGHRVVNPNVADMAGERAPVHVARADLRDNLVVPRAPVARGEGVVSPRHNLRPTAKSPAPLSSSTSKMPQYDATLRSEVGEEAKK